MAVFCHTLNMLVVLYTIYLNIFYLEPLSYPMYQFFQMLKYIEDEEPNLEDMQEYVDGYIETISLTNGFTMVLGPTRRKPAKHQRAAPTPHKPRLCLLCASALVRRMAYVRFWF